MEVEEAAAGANPEITLVVTEEVYRCSVVGRKSTWNNDPPRRRRGGICYLSKQTQAPLSSLASGTGRGGVRLAPVHWLAAAVSEGILMT